MHHEGEDKGRANETDRDTDCTGDDTEQKTDRPEEDLHTDEPQTAVKVEGEDQTGCLEALRAPIEHQLLHEAVVEQTADKREDHIRANEREGQEAEIKRFDKTDDAEEEEQTRDERRDDRAPDKTPFDPTSIGVQRFFFA